MNGSGEVVGWDPDSEIWGRVWGDIMDGVTLGFDVEPGYDSVQLDRFSLVIVRARGRPVRDARHRRAVRLPSYAYYIVDRALRSGHTNKRRKRHQERKLPIRARRRFEYGNITDWLIWG